MSDNNCLVIPAHKNILDIPKATIQTFLPGTLSWATGVERPVSTHADFMGIFDVPYCEVEMRLTRT